VASNVGDAGEVEMKEPRFGGAFALSTS